MVRFTKAAGSGQRYPAAYLCPLSGAYFNRMGVYALGGRCLLGNRVAGKGSSRKLYGYDVLIKVLLRTIHCAQRSAEASTFCLPYYDETQAFGRRVVEVSTFTKGEKMSEQAKKAGEQAQQAGEQAQKNADQGQKNADQAQKNVDKATQ